MAKYFKKSEGYNPKELIQYGLDHLNAGQILFVASPSYFDSAGYLVHIGFELVLKAWHLETFDQFPDTHSLKNLIKELNESGQAVNLSDQEKQALEMIDEYSQLRYPLPASGIEVGDDDILAIDKLFKSIWQQTPPQLRGYFKLIDSLKKGNRILMKKPINPIKNA